MEGTLLQVHRGTRLVPSGCGWSLADSGKMQGSESLSTFFPPPSPLPPPNKPPNGLQQREMSHVQYFQFSSRVLEQPQAGQAPPLPRGAECRPRVQGSSEGNSNNTPLPPTALIQGALPSPDQGAHGPGTTVSPRSGLPREDYQSRGCTPLKKGKEDLLLT